VLKPGLATPEMLRRFARESQVLARLQHPGMPKSMRPGRLTRAWASLLRHRVHSWAPLRAYAGAHHSRQRLELMARVCNEVENAHQRGFIDRDLKPGKYLSEESGQPKILDFGVARAAGSDAQATKQTDVGQLIGTLAYMSPEHVLADPLELALRAASGEVALSVWISVTGDAC
jgi:eukaryotic-like serine/threonine-protein kinase